MSVTTAGLTSVAAQAERLIALGVHDLAGIVEQELRQIATAQSSQGALLVVHPDRVAVSDLAPLISHRHKPGFVVVDMPDVDAFTSIEQSAPPASPLYAVTGLERGDAMANWSPNEALPAILASGRTPLTLIEGIHWLLQQPEALERNRCFMTIGSRLRKGQRRIGRAHSRDLDQQRGGTRRGGQPSRAEGGLVLGEQSTHLARLRLSVGTARARFAREALTSEHRSRRRLCPSS